jgi:undecaprenyl-diphosphatase
VACVRVALGLTGMILTVLPLRRLRIGPLEARAFRLVNGLPEFLYRPTWVVMQLGALGGAWAVAGVAYVGGRRQLAVRLAEAGSITWLLSKVVKRVVRRGRPASLLDGVHHRGRPAGGLGYLSGHAGVAVALAAAALPALGRRGRLSILALAPIVGLGRIYVGAHLPLDVAGGAALGLAVDGALSLRAARH